MYLFLIKSLSKAIWARAVGWTAIGLFLAWLLAMPQGAGLFAHPEVGTERAPTAGTAVLPSGCEEAAPVSEALASDSSESVSSLQLLCLNDAPAPKKLGLAQPAGRVRLTSGLEEPSPRRGLNLNARPENEASPAPVRHETNEGLVSRALRAINECQDRFRSVRDYSCTLHKRERVQGRMTPLYVMSLKVRTQPRSIYLKIEQPSWFHGREAIYVEGRNSGRVLAHDVGLNKLLAGTLELEPTCSRAMEDCRHPITEAGVGALIETVSRKWTEELDPDHSLLLFDRSITVGSHHCRLIESIHPQKSPDFLFHKVRLFIDDEHGLPIRFEAYDWPETPNDPGELVEEYTYENLKLNVGLNDTDFEINNAQYSFGHF